MTNLQTCMLDTVFVSVANDKKKNCGICRLKKQKLHIFCTNADAFEVHFTPREKAYEIPSKTKGFLQDSYKRNGDSK